FFQAEDGIRDRNVTGVQTCALPILTPAIAWRRGKGGSRTRAASARPCAGSGRVPGGVVAASLRAVTSRRMPTSSTGMKEASPTKIGRASCRESGEGREAAETEQGKR